MKSQEEMIEKIKKGDLLSNDFSHKYYVKQFSVAKKLKEYHLIIDRTTQGINSYAF